MRKVRDMPRIVSAAALVAAVLIGLGALVVAHQALLRIWQLEAGQVKLGHQIDQLSDALQGSQEGRARNSSLPKDWARGGQLVVRMRSAPTAIHPLLVREASAKPVIDLLFEPLIRPDPDDPTKFLPVLAGLPEISDDRLTYTFSLNQLSRFSDGWPVTAEDVVFTFESLRDPALDDPARASSLPGLESVTAVTPLKLRFKFATPYFLALPAIAAQPILPKHVYAFTDARQLQEKSAQIVGSGPFVLEESQFSPKSKKIALLRNEDYWDRGGLAALERIEFRVVEEDLRASQLLRTGGLDLTDLAPEQAVEVGGDPNFRQYYRLFDFYVPSSGNVYIGWNNRRPPFSDVRVRQAMTALAPRQEIVDRLYKGRARLIASPFWSDGPQAEPELKPAASDASLGVGLLEAAGWLLGPGPERSQIRQKEGKPLQFTLLAGPASGGLETIDKLFHEELQKVGVEMKVERLDWDELEQRLQARDFDAVLYGWTSALEIDPYRLWHSSQGEKGGRNFVGFANPEADRLTEDIRREMNDVKRNQMCHALGRLLQREQPYTLLLEPATLVGLSNRFKGVRLYRIGLRPQEWYLPAVQ